MKKISPKIVALAIMILSFVGLGAFGVHKAVAPSGGGVEQEWDPSGG